jgi:hypothetical protein
VSDPDPRPFGRRAFLLLTAGGLSSFAWAGWASRVFSPVTSQVTQLVSDVLPVGGWRIYTISGSMPVFDPRTWRLQVDGLVRRPRSIGRGRLNAGQKLNAIVTTSFAVLFTVTGVLLWYGERNTRFRFADTILIHDWLMYISFFLFLGHLYLSIVHPRTRHAFVGITRGWVDEDWALQHHRKGGRAATRSSRPG